MSNRFSPQVESALKAAGWFEGRRVDLDKSSLGALSLFNKAEDVLNEFGGLHFGNCGPGIDCATSDVKIDPSVAVHLAPELRTYASARSTRLFPLGEVHRGHGYLVIDEAGNIYLLSDVLEPFAPTFPQSLELLLLGRKPSPGTQQISAH